MNEKNLNALFRDAVFDVLRNVHFRELDSFKEYVFDRIEIMPWFGMAFCDLLKDLTNFDSIYREPLSFMLTEPTITIRSNSDNRMQSMAFIDKVRQDAKGIYIDPIIIRDSFNGNDTDYLVLSASITEAVMLLSWKLSKKLELSDWLSMEEFKLVCWMVQEELEQQKVRLAGIESDFPLELIETKCSNYFFPFYRRCLKFVK